MPFFLFEMMNALSLELFFVVKNKKNKDNIENAFGSKFLFVNARACLITVFENRFLFSKTMRIRKTGRRCLVPIFIYFSKNTEKPENTKFR